MRIRRARREVGDRDWRRSSFLSVRDQWGDWGRRMRWWGRLRKASWGGRSWAA